MTSCWFSISKIFNSILTLILFLPALLSICISQVFHYLPLFLCAPYVFSLLGLNDGVNPGFFLLTLSWEQGLLCVRCLSGSLDVTRYNIHKLLLLQCPPEVGYLILLFFRLERCLDVIFVFLRLDIFLCMKRLLVQMHLQVETGRVEKIRLSHSHLFFIPKCCLGVESVYLCLFFVILLNHCFDPVT